MERVLDDYYNEGNTSYTCAAWAPVVGFAGVAFAVVFASEYDAKHILRLAYSKQACRSTSSSFLVS
jgi:hypothetical protein